MSRYVDGYVIPIKKSKLKAYKKMATLGCKTWLKHGALDYYECVGDDLKNNMGLTFPVMCKLKADETVIFAYIVYKSKAHRNQVNKKVHEEFIKMMDIKYSDISKRVSHGRWKGKSPINRFWEKVDIKGDDECWEWKGSVNTNGYGMLGIGQSRIVASRMSWVIHHGYLDNRMLVCHFCDNPKCVNPEHLFLGTNSDNIKDMYDKGRREANRGQKCPTSILKDKDVIYMRENYYPRTKETRDKFARMFGITEGSVQNILYRVSWKWI